MKYIYALTYLNFLNEEEFKQNSPTDIYFYIGITSDPFRREKEHKYNSNSGHEDVYKFTRELTQKGITWELGSLNKIEEKDMRPWEYYYIIKFIQDGFSLKNMKFGVKNEKIHDFLVEIAAENKEINIDNLSNLIREKENKHLPHDSDFSASERVQARAIKKKMRFVRSYIDESKGFRQNFNVFDLGPTHGEVHAEKGITMLEIAKSHTPARIQWWKDFKETNNLADFP